MIDDLLEPFVEEARELVDQANQDIDALEAGAEDPAGALDRLFRAFHTLKGSAGLVGFAPMGELFHAAEDRLSEVRAGERVLDEELSKALVAVLDQTERWLEVIAATLALPAGDEPGVAALLRRLRSAAATDRPGVSAGSGARGPAGGGASAAEPSGARSLRIPVDRVDALGADVDDLAVIRNQLAYLIGQAAPALDLQLARELVRRQSELDRRVSRLFADVTRLRLVPVAPVFRRFPRLVREISAALGKRVELSVTGGDVEVDKSVVDDLFEPLLHLVRNALDHGVETPDERRGAGKPETAKLGLGAYPLADEVVIEVADDGRGIDPRRVRDVALARGVATIEALEAMDEEAVRELIFAPGFSTASQVGDLSGRGVGLNAVKAKVAALGGRIGIASRPGEGTRLSLYLPLRVRLARIMTVSAGSEVFGVPLETVIETVRVSSARVTPVRAGRAIVWRDRPVPLLPLASLLRLPEPAAAPDELKVLIIQAGEDLAAICVDAFGERLETPLRPMTGLLSRAPGLAGTALMGDGRVLMVLDLEALMG